MPLQTPPRAEILELAISTNAFSLTPHPHNHRTTSRLKENNNQPATLVSNVLHFLWSAGHMLSQPYLKFKCCRIGITEVLMDVCVLSHTIGACVCCVCKFLGMSPCAHACMHLCFCMYVRLAVCKDLCACICMYLHVCMIYAWFCMCVCMYMYMYVYVYAFVCFFCTCMRGIPVFCPSNWEFAISVSKWSESNFHMDLHTWRSGFLTWYFLLFATNCFMHWKMLSLPKRCKIHGPNNLRLCNHICKTPRGRWPPTQNTWSGIEQGK